MTYIHKQTTDYIGLLREPLYIHQLSVWYNFSSAAAAPQKTTYSEIPSQIAAQLRIGSPYQAGEIAGYEPWITG
jgi:hypothetical protein